MTTDNWNNRVFCNYSFMRNTEICIVIRSSVMDQAIAWFMKIVLIFQCLYRKKCHSKLQLFLLSSSTLMLEFHWMK